MAICALMAVVNALRFRRRGAAAFALSAAFIALGFSAWIYSIDPSSVWLDVGVAATVVLLIADFAIRAAKFPGQGTRR